MQDKKLRQKQGQVQGLDYLISDIKIRCRIMSRADLGDFRCKSAGRSKVRAYSRQEQVHGRFRAIAEKGPGTGPRQLKV